MFKGSAGMSAEFQVKFRDTGPLLKEPDNPTDWVGLLLMNTQGTFKTVQAWLKELNKTGGGRGNIFSKHITS